MKNSKFNTKKLTKISKQKRKVKISKLSKKKQLENKIQAVFASEEFKAVEEALNSIKELNVQTREQRRLFLAKMYCHINTSFDVELYKRGLKEYLLRLFTVKRNDKGKDIHQDILSSAQEKQVINNLIYQFILHFNIQHFFHTRE